MKNMGKNKPVDNLNKEVFSLSVKDFLHLESDKHIEHDNNQYVLKQPIQKKEEAIRPLVVLSKSEVAQYFSTGKGDDTNVKLVKKAQEAIKVLKEHAKQEEIGKEETAEKSNAEASQKQIIEEGLSLDFNDLISDSVLKGLKDM
jgi:intergrase/recombinase